MSVNTLRPRHNGRHFADDIFKCIFLNENVWIPIQFSLKFVPKGPINYIPALVQIMAWRRPGDKPLFEPMMISLLTHICVTRPQWVKFGKNEMIRFHLSSHNLGLGYIKMEYMPYQMTEFFTVCPVTNIQSTILNEKCICPVTNIQNTILNKNVYMQNP